MSTQTRRRAAATAFAGAALALPGAGTAFPAKNDAEHSSPTSKRARNAPAHVRAGSVNLQQILALVDVGAFALLRTSGTY